MDNLNFPDSTTNWLSEFANANSLTGSSNVIVFISPALSSILSKSLSLFTSGVKEAYKSDE